MRISLAILASGACVAMLLGAGAAAADAARGRGLYEQRCADCHSESVHGRTKRVAGSYEEVRAWVERWSKSLQTGWGPSEVEDVTLYLNDRYYHFAIPARARW